GRFIESAFHRRVRLIQKYFRTALDFFQEFIQWFPLPFKNFLRAPHLFVSFITGSSLQVREDVSTLGLKGLNMSRDTFRDDPTVIGFGSIFRLQHSFAFREAVRRKVMELGPF